MCGIVGCLEKTKCIDRGVVQNMMNMLTHRGPDDQGYEQFNIAGGNLGMGFVRLSIRDLSEAGHQPMYNKSGEIALTLNGEIYNADELRQPLIDAGYQFRSTSDTEVLLYLYECYGIDKMLKMLDGMYAVCIVDKAKDCFYLIRDRLGEKPLYTYDNGDTLLYASEYKAFYCHPCFKAELNQVSVDEYFLFRYVAGGETLLKGVRNLQPGSYLKIDAIGVQQTIYWDFPDEKQNEISYDESKQGYERLLKTSLQRRLISDRKVGLQLSGGVDSSLLAHMASPMLKEKLQTFSIVFEDTRYSEKQYQDEVVKKEGCEPHFFEYSPKMFFDCWRECTWYFEAPMNHEGSLGLLFLNRRSKDYVTVMLCGEGSDETLGGYGQFYNYAKLLEGGIIPFTFNLFKRTLRTCCLPIFFDYDGEVIHGSQYIRDDMFYRLRPGGRRSIKRVYDKRRKLMGNGDKHMGKLRRWMNYETKTYMQDLLMRADKTSMASSMEVRVPFIMPQLVEYACKIPDQYLVDTSKDIHHGTKSLLKDICSKVYGQDFTYRKKSGFAAPVLRFFCEPEVKKYIETVLIPGIERRGVINHKEIKKMWEKCKRKKGDSYSIQWPLWCAFSFELWAQMYLDKSPQEWIHIEF